MGRLSWAVTQKLKPEWPFWSKIIAVEMAGEVWGLSEGVVLPVLSYVSAFTVMKPNRIYPPNCRAAVYLIPLRWRPDYWPEEFPETRWKDLHSEKPPVCGESAPRHYRGRDEKVVWEVWQGRGSLHTQGQRLWLYQAGEWLATLGMFLWQWPMLEECC